MSSNLWQWALIASGPTDGKAALVCVSLGFVRQGGLKALGPVAKTPTHSQCQLFPIHGL